MNEAQKRLAKRVLSMNSSRKDKTQGLNSSLYDKRTFNEMRESLANYPADKLKTALSGYITDPIFITNVTNDNGNITVNYRFLDENLNEEFINAEIGYGLDYIENIHLFSSRQNTDCGRKPMIHRLRSVNSNKMTADQAKQKYKELLTQCYISVYDHKLDVNDPQVVEYRKQMNDIKSEFGDVANTMDGYIKSLDKKYKNTVDFTAEELDSGLFSKKEKPSEEILKMYKQLKKSIDNLIKAGTPASNSNLKNMQNKASEFEKKYDSKALKMALAASRRVGRNSLRRKLNSSTIPNTFYIQIPKDNTVFEISKNPNEQVWEERIIYPTQKSTAVTYENYLTPEDILQWYINDFGDAHIISEAEVNDLFGYEDEETYGPDYEYYRTPIGTTVIRIEDIKPYFGDRYFNVETRGKYTKFIEFEDCTKQEMLDKLAEVIGVTELFPATESEFNSVAINSSRRNTRYTRRRDV